MSATGSTSSHGTHSRSPSRSRSPPPYSDGRYASRYRYDYNYRSGRSMSAALDDYRDLRDRERDRERMIRDDRYMPPRRDRYAPPYYRDDLHYPPPPPHSYSKIPPGPLRRDEPKDKIPSSSNSVSKDLKDDKPIPSASEPYGRYVDWRERRYRDEERRRDYDRRYMRYDAPGYGPPLPFSSDSYRNDRDLPPSPGIPYYERDRLDDRDYYRRPPPSDYDRYRPNNGNSSGRGGPGRLNWRPQSDDRRMMDRDRDREKPYNFNRMNDSVKPPVQQQLQPHMQQHQQLQAQKQQEHLQKQQEQFNIQKREHFRKQHEQAVARAREENLQMRKRQEQEQEQKQHEQKLKLEQEQQQKQEQDQKQKTKEDLEHLQDYQNQQHGYQKNMEHIRNIEQKKLPEQHENTEQLEQLEQQRKQIWQQNKQQEQEKHKKEVIQNMQHIQRRNLQEEQTQNEQLQREQYQREKLQILQLQREQLKKEQLQKEQLQKEQLQKEQLLREQLQKEQLQKEQLHKEQLQREQLQREQIQKEQFQREQLQKEQLQKEQLQKEQLQKEQLQKEQLQKEQLQKEQLQKEQLQKEQLQKEQLQKEQFQKEQLQKEQFQKEQLQKEKLQKEQLQKEQLQKEQLQKEQLQKEQLQKEQLQREQIQKEQLQKEQEQQKLQQEQEQRQQEYIKNEKLKLQKQEDLQKEKLQTKPEIQNFVFQTPSAPEEEKPATAHAKPEVEDMVNQTKKTPESVDIPRNHDTEVTNQEKSDGDEQSEMTQEQIVERIDHIENEISRYEEMLEAANRREEEESKTNDEEEDNEEERKAQREEAKRQALHAMDDDTPSAVQISELVNSQVMRNGSKRGLINQLRGIDELDERLYEQIIQDNKKIARENSRMIGGWQNKKEDVEDWSEEERWSKPLYKSIEDYVCYQENIKGFSTLRVKIADTLRTQDVTLKKKGKFLKSEFKSLYEQWKEKNLALDRIRDHEQKVLEKYNRGSTRRREDSGAEEYIDQVIFVAGASDALRFKNNGTSTPYTNNSLYTSDAARSEAELLEIIQSLETAEMRNPESRAKKTTATIPPMIIDARERMRTFDDRSGLIEDPLTYYHTGPDTGDIWNQQEVTTFMESYMMYPKQFERISMAVGTKTAPQCVLFYYRKKKKIDFKALMKKGKRGKTNKHHDKIQNAIKKITDGYGSKSKGSALMDDIGQAQNSRKAKEKDAEQKSRDLRNVDQPSSYWSSERKKYKRPSVATGGVSEDTEMLNENKRKQAPNQSLQLSGQRRKGRSPRESMQVSDLIYTNDTNKRTLEGSGEEEDEKVYSGGSTKWTDREKETVIEAFKQYGRNFSRVSNLLPSKTEEQVRNFYHNFKRKNGPNVFNEETNARENALQDTAFSGRIDLKAEEDAAAALVGMFQMGANREGISRSRTPSSYEEMALGASTPPPQVPPGGGIAGAQKRRRVRTVSGRTENTMDEDWTDGDYATKGGSRKLSRTASLTDKRSSHSSYWSVAERNDFIKYLGLFGRDWEKLSIAMKSKTAIQVRNFYANNEDKMHLKEILDRFHSRQRSGASHIPSSLPNYSYPSSIHPTIAQPSSSSHAYNMGNRSGYFSAAPDNRMIHPAYPENSRPLRREPEPISTSAVTKVADLLNNDDPAEANQNSWETWFGS